MSAFEKFSNGINRRDFLKLSGLGLLSFAFPGTVLASTHINQSILGDDILGRIVSTGTVMYTSPTFTSGKVKTLWTDVIMPIRDVTIGDQNPPYNRVWYNLDGQGYVHSGSVQPVRIKVNTVSEHIPEVGCLAEVTVPYTDARWWAPSVAATAYRLYYGSTYWVTGITADDQGLAFYQIYDNLVKRYYYAQANHLRLVPAEDLAPISPDIPPEDKRIEVYLENQAVIAYEKDIPVFMARAATGAKFSNGDFTTPTGPHTVLYKSPTHHMSSGDDQSLANSYDLPGVPWDTYITENGLAFHGTYWHNDFGKPRSHGCVNLTPEAASWIFRWTTPVVPPEVSLSFEGGGTSIMVI